MLTSIVVFDVLCFQNMTLPPSSSYYVPYSLNPWQLNLVTHLPIYPPLRFLQSSSGQGDTDWLTDSCGSRRHEIFSPNLWPSQDKADILWACLKMFKSLGWVLHLFDVSFLRQNAAMLRMLEFSWTVPYKDMKLCVTVHWKITSDDRMENKGVSHVFWAFFFLFLFLINVKWNSQQFLSETEYSVRKN